MFHFYFSLTTSSFFLNCHSFLFSLPHTLSPSLSVTLTLRLSLTRVTHGMLLCFPSLLSHQALADIVLDVPDAAHIFRGFVERAAADGIIDAARYLP